MTHDVAAQVRVYLMVFGALLVLTLITVGVSYLDLPEFETVIVALIIATTKASLVAMFFMFQVYRDFEKEVNAARSIDLSRKLNPSLQSFDQWLAGKKSAVLGATNPAPATA